MVPCCMPTAPLCYRSAGSDGGGGWGKCLVRLLLRLLLLLLPEQRPLRQHLHLHLGEGQWMWLMSLLLWGPRPWPLLCGVRALCGRRRRVGLLRLLQ